MSNRDDLISGAEKYLRRELTDDEKQQLIHASNSFKLGDNDALWIVISMLESNKWSLGETLESYREKFEAIPEQIKKAADAERKSLTATANVGAIQAQDRINDSVLALLPNIRADITKAVSRSASTAIKRIELGRGFISLGAGGMIASALLILEVIIGTGIAAQLSKKPQDISDYWTILGFSIQVAIACPIMFAFGIFAIENEYNDGVRIAGFLGILASTGTLLVIVLKVFKFLK